MEELGIITHIKAHETTTWSTALHLASKGEGEIRAVGDFRPLNHRTLLDGFPLPNIRNFSSKMRNATIFSKIDLVKAFHQIRIRKQDWRSARIQVILL